MVGMAAGLTNLELGERNTWTEHTVETYLKNFNAKLGIHSRSEATHQIIMELLDCLARHEATPGTPEGGGG